MYLSSRWRNKTFIFSYREFVYILNIHALIAHVAFLRGAGSYSKNSHLNLTATTTTIMVLFRVHDLPYICYTFILLITPIIKEELSNPLNRLKRYDSLYGLPTLRTVFENLDHKPSY